MTRNILDLIQTVKSETTNGLPFMEGKEKGTIILGQVYKVKDYGYLEGEDGEFIVFTTEEEPNNFMFGSSVMTEKFKKIDSVLAEQEISTLLDNGIEVVFSSKMSKNKRKYTLCELFPTK